MEAPLFVGVDVGTGSARAGLFDQTGTLLASHKTPFPMWREGGDIVEQSSAAIWTAVCASVRQAVAGTDTARVARASAKKARTGASTASRPPARPSTRSAWAATKSISWHTRITARPAAFSAAMMAPRRARRSASRPRCASSSKITPGAQASTEATATKRRAAASRSSG